MLPTTPGSKKATWTLSQFSRYAAPFHCNRWSRNSVFQPISLFVSLSDWYEEGMKYCGTRPGVKACGELPFWLKPPGRKPSEYVPYTMTSGVTCQVRLPRLLNPD